MVEATCNGYLVHQLFSSLTPWNVRQLGFEAMKIVFHDHVVCSIWIIPTQRTVYV